MTLAAFDAGPAQRDTLVEQNIVADLRCLADDDPEAVVDKQALADFGSRVDFNSGQQTRNVGDEPRGYIKLAFIEPERKAVAQDGMQAWIAEQNFLAALSGRVFPIDGLDVLAKRHCSIRLLCQMRLPWLKMLHVNGGDRTAVLRGLLFDGI